MGTHPIFESDFDCLTEFRMMNRTIVTPIRRLTNIQGALFVCDMQESFRGSIKYFPEIANSTANMIEFAKVMEYPIAVTEQYSRGLGKTIHELEAAHEFVLSDKTQFSMFTPEVNQFMEEHKPSDVFICGIEAHACIQCTVQDLIERNINAHVVIDAVSSGNQVNRFSAFRQMEKIGANLVTSEQVILQTMANAKHPKFKSAQKILIKSPMMDSGLESFF